jgi:hypothetical protein
MDCYKHCRQELSDDEREDDDNSSKEDELDAESSSSKNGKQVSICFQFLNIFQSCNFILPFEAGQKGINVRVKMTIQSLQTRTAMAKEKQKVTVKGMRSTENKTQKKNQLLKQISKLKSKMEEELQFMLETCHP